MQFACHYCGMFLDLSIGSLEYCPGCGLVYECIVRATPQSLVAKLEASRQQVRLCGVCMKVGKAACPACLPPLKLDCVPTCQEAKA